MALEDKPEMEDYQDPFLNWLAQWYAQPQGRQVRERFLERIRRYGEPGPGDLAVELAPIPILEDCDALQAPLIRIASPNPMLRMDPEAWPLESACAQRVVLAHPGAQSPHPAAVVAEAARVLEPEGRIFLLEGNRLQRAGRNGVRASALPEGLRRRQYRELLEGADLEVLDQWSLSLLPPGLPAAWQKRLAAMDAWTLRGLPPLASMILTVAHKRVDMPLRPAQRFRFATPNPAMRPGLVSSRSSHSHFHSQSRAR
ncbi:hypothetical protein [Thioalkalivibrio sp. ALJ7]|uniref:hypothetical protein n=1 Tax=Thioalkalivibrio sp. ALJ7 TaxID=1158756 RepID=UPI00036BC45D|nr:hypothetical protein [Thioalkalivibrio sp. ALJ7]